MTLPALGASGMPVKPDTSSPEKIKETAGQFEALLIGQMLKSMRESSSSGGWLGSGEDSAGSSMMELAEQQLSRMLASQGGLGLAKLVQQGLSRKSLEVTQK